MTPRRLFRLKKALHQRQTDLAVALEKVHDPHNLAAILRSADAVGVSRVIWAPDKDNPEPPNPEVSKSGEKWVELIQTQNIFEKLNELKSVGFNIAATHLAADSIDFRKIDWTKPWCVVMGNERKGCSDKILSICDKNIQLPMMGLVQSLNVSVATAVIFYEIQRQRLEKGLYSKKLSKDEVIKFYNYWKLVEEGIQVEDLLNPPEVDDCLPDSPHQDGRAIFLEKREIEKQLKQKR
ncbi:MAG: RNA methyltransferase [Candidatus Riflebacteria bacterium]|nr:RNA methyltransferase [Candidatus Riflebacteria bacterium]